MKNKIETYIILGLFYVFAVSCGGSDDDPPAPPPPPNLAPSVVESLIYPTPDLLCIDNTVEFKWGNATDPENDAIKYKITVASDRELTNVVKQRLVATNSTVFTFEKGKALYWNMIAVDRKNNEGPASATQAFYTSGSGTTNHAPFTAVLVAPENKSTINFGTISLMWSGSDADIDDVLTYELFFGESNNPSLKQANITDTSFDIAVETGKTYYWKVNSIDNSGVKTIGQVWEFLTN